MCILYRVVVEVPVQRDHSPCLLAEAAGGVTVPNQRKAQVGTSKESARMARSAKLPISRAKIQGFDMAFTRSR